MLRQRGYILGVLWLGLVLIVAGCQPVEQSDEGPKPVAVEVAPVARGEVQSTTTLSGRIEARADVPVLARLAAQVTAVKVKVGESVQAGQALVELDKKDVVEQVRQAEAALAMAEAVLPPESGESAAVASARVMSENAQADLERMEYLWQQGAISEQMLEAARAQAAGAAAQYEAALDREKTAQAQYEQAQAALALARSQLANTTITAPVSGVVASLQVKVGQMLSPGVVVANVVDMDQVQLKLNVSERDINKLTVGQTVKVRISSLGNEEFAGELTSLAPAVDARTLTFPAEVTVDNPQHRVKPGMFAEVDLETAAVLDVLVVPRAAILEEGDQQYAYVVTDGKAELRAVTLGLANEETVEVKTGLNEGDLLVVKGQQYLSQGLPVTVVKGGEAQ
ncbi:MAG: efflux RND transporter periplasmic adaptor subunit [bacterium]|jgi:HlyD family secretion protein